MVKSKANSIASIMTVTVLAGMLLGFGIREAVVTTLPRLGIPTERATAIGERRYRSHLAGMAATLIETIESTSADARSTLISSASKPGLKIDLLDAPVPHLGNDKSPDIAALRAQIAFDMSDSRLLIVADGSASYGKQAAIQADNQTRQLLVEAQLSDGHWVLLTIKASPLPTVDTMAQEFRMVSLLLSLILSLLAAIVLSFIAARHAAAPLSELAWRLEHFDGNEHLATVNPQGPREVRRAITAFNRMQERLGRFEESRARMISAMYHDLRTPLTRLRLRAELVDDLDQQQKMFSEIDRLNAMIDSILSFARDDAKREPRSLVDLSALVEGICDDAADVGKPVTYSGRRDVTISCRPTAMRRAISNLIDNAVKYGGKADVTLAPEAEYAVILIEDEGPGIPRSEREKVFEPFYRLESSRNGDTGGVGLGLSVARSAITEHGGDIELSNRREGGLTVRVEMPLWVRSGTTSG